MKTVTREELKSMLDHDEDFELINVLPEEKFRQAHIPGSSNIPVDDADFTRKVKKQVSQDDMIVVYCASSDCNASRTAAARLEQEGFSHVFAYEGGIRGWQEGGYPLEGRG